MRFFITILYALMFFESAVFATEIETRSLDELYAEAIKEGGEFVLRAGGDKDDQADYYLNMFKKRFPKIKLTHSVDLSFYHASRYDNALENGDDANVPDVIQLQTLHDYDYYNETRFVGVLQTKKLGKGVSRL